MLANACLDAHTVPTVIQALKTFSEDVKMKAFAAIPEEYKGYIEQKVGATKRCKGWQGQACVFALSQTGGCAQTHGRGMTCLFCNPEQLEEKCGTERGRKQVRGMLHKLHPEIKTRAITERMPGWLQEHFQGDRMAPPTSQRRRKRPAACDEEPIDRHVREAELEEGKQKWRLALKKRGAVGKEASKEDQRVYRANLLDDRARAQRTLGTGKRKRHERNSEVPNETGLPPAKRSRLAADLEQWSTFDSWAICEECSVMQPRNLVPKNFGRLLSPYITAKACNRCRAKGTTCAPSVEDVPKKLQGLSKEATLALSPLVIDVGPEVRAQNKSGYRQHTGMIRFSWHEDSVRDRIEDIENSMDKQAAMKAYKYLLRQETSAYAEFIQEHKAFLRKHPNATEKQRKVWLRFIEREGLECALWPTLFWETSMTFTWARARDPKRQAHEQAEPLERRLNAGRPRRSMTDDEAEVDNAREEDDEPEYVARVKRTFAALAMSPVLDYGGSYELLHFIYDLNLWSALGSKKGLGLDSVPMRLMMRGHTFSPVYWRDVHRALIDMVRQRGFPQIFWTTAPYEWSFPYHEHVKDTMQKMLRERLHLPVHETLHMVHVLTQCVRGLRTGKNAKTWTRHVLKGEAEDGTPVDIAYMLRIEFQDGTRKDPTQDYHGSGRPHIHVLIWVSPFRKCVPLPTVAATTMDLSDDDMKGYVEGSQLDSKGETPWKVHTGPSCWAELQREGCELDLRHTEEDHREGVRAYFLDIMDALKCHQDLQVSGRDNGALMNYVAKYTAKFSDSLQEELLNDDLDGNSLAVGVLSRYKPMEPEMVLQLFGSRYRQWHISTKGGGKRSFLVPVPDAESLPEEVLQYEQCEWKGPKTSLLDFLRKTTGDGRVCHWLKQLHKKHVQDGGHQSRQDFVRDYTCQGEKVVAAEMLSRLNDRFYGQWLMLHCPFTKASDFLLDAEAEQRVPPEHKYFAMALQCRHEVAKKMWCKEAAIQTEMEEEAHTGRYIRSTIAMVMAQQVLVQAYLKGEYQGKADAAGEDEAKRTIRLPIEARFEDLISKRKKDVEARIYTGQAAEVRRGDILQLGATRSRVLSVDTFATFEDALENYGYQRLIPGARTMADAATVYRAIKGYTVGEQRHGVVAFELQPAENLLPGCSDGLDFNTQQRHFKRAVDNAVDRALMVHQASAMDDTYQAAQEALENGKINVCFGPPGAGKTTVVFACIQRAISKGANVLFALPTAQLASRMKVKCGQNLNISIDTCHAAFGLGEDSLARMPVLEPYDLIVVDEISQLEAKHFKHIAKLWLAVDKVPALVILGDKFQMAGFGEGRPWQTNLWKQNHFTTVLHKNYRCVDEEYNKILRVLRTSQPTPEITVKKILKNRCAWKGQQPTLADIRRILRAHPNTTMMAISRRAAQELNDLAVQVKFPKRKPLEIIDADLETNPANYDQHGALFKDARDLTPLKMPVHKGMRVYLTQNIRKETDFVNGMNATVERYDRNTRGLWVITDTGYRNILWPWSDPNFSHGNKTYYPVRPGYASTVMKYQGAELDHVTLYLDTQHVPGAAYTAMSRVKKGKDILIGGGVERAHFTPVQG